MHTSFSFSTANFCCILFIDILFFFSRSDNFQGFACCNRRTSLRKIYCRNIIFRYTEFYLKYIPETYFYSPVFFFSFYWTIFRFEFGTSTWATTISLFFSFFFLARSPFFGFEGLQVFDKNEIIWPDSRFYWKICQLITITSASVKNDLFSSKIVK